MSDDTTRSGEEIVAELVDATPICMLTITESDGTLTSRPLNRQGEKFRNTLDFLVPRDGDLIATVHSHGGAVNVAIQSSKGFVSIAGTAREVTDRSVLRDEFNAAASAFFPDGPETATVLRVDAESAEYWDSRGSSVAKIASFVKAAVTDNGERPDMGTSGTVEL